MYTIHVTFKMRYVIVYFNSAIAAVHLISVFDQFQLTMLSNNKCQKNLFSVRPLNDPNNSKYHYSNSSLLLRSDDEIIKSKIFLSPNNYALITDNNTDVDNTTHSISSLDNLAYPHEFAQDIDPSTPPINIINV